MTPPLLTRSKPSSTPSGRSRPALGGDLAGPPETAQPRDGAEWEPDQTSTSKRRWPWRRAPKSEEAGAGGAEWAGSSDLAAKAMTAGLVAAVIAGPVALVMEMRSSDAVVVQQAAPASEPSSTAPTLAGERGLQTVRAWLSSTAEDPQLPSARTWPKNASPASSLRVAQVSGTSDPKTFQVLIAASIKGREHFFEVPVQADKQQASAVALPASAPAPRAAKAPGDSYGQRGVALSSPLAQTVEEFLASYLSGKSTTRVTSPGVELASVTGSPWDGVALSNVDAQVASGQDATASPAEGEVAQVRAEYVMTRGGDRSTGLSSQIALTLTARGGRWEITSVDPAPLVDPKSTSPAGGEETSAEDTNEGTN